MTFLLAFFITFIACVIFVPVLTGLGKFFCLFATVRDSILALSTFARCTFATIK